jgi:protein tyrosine phosphatase (PTP) superfamily phosphohydrolase (DUF442 family)
MRFLKLSMVAMLAAAGVAAPAAAQRMVGANPKGDVVAPVILDTTDVVQARFARAAEDLWIGGQPSEKALRDLKAQGVTTVVSLRTPTETNRYGFDEPAVVKELGMNFVRIPVRGDSAFPYSPEALKTFTKVMHDADGKVLLHCTIAWRASHLYAAYLIQERHVPVETALKYARSINLMDDMRMGTGDKQPVEEFLGHALPEVGHPKKP